jgi:hypothetical protein
LEILSAIKTKAKIKRARVNQSECLVGKQRAIIWPSGFVGTDPAYRSCDFSILRRAFQFLMLLGFASCLRCATLEKKTNVTATNTLKNCLLNRSSDPLCTLPDRFRTWITQRSDYGCRSHNTLGHAVLLNDNGDRFDPSRCLRFTIAAHPNTSFSRCRCLLVCVSVTR